MGFLPECAMWFSGVIVERSRKTEQEGVGGQGLKGQKQHHKGPPLACIPVST